VLNPSPSTDERLVILLHGIGGTGATLMPVAESWRHVLPNVRFAAPNAPYRHMYGYGYQWFGVEPEQLRPDRLQIVRQAFDDVIREILRKEGFEDRLRHVTFVGVSQGAIMGLDGVASGRWPIGALVCFAGLLSPTPVSEIGKDTPVLLVHGQTDRTIPATASEVAARQLRAAGFDVSLKILPGVGHTVTLEGAQAALHFLQDRAFLVVG
jgi:phospholipase/carboxylesterase